MVPDEAVHAGREPRRLVDQLVVEAVRPLGQPDVLGEGPLEPAEPLADLTAPPRIARRRPPPRVWKESISCRYSAAPAICTSPTLEVARRDGPWLPG